MTADPAALLRIADEVEALEERDCEMDARVWCALHPGFERGASSWVRESGKRWQEASAYTASVDAAYALFLEVLPGWTMQLWDEGEIHEANLFPPNDDAHDGYLVSAPTLPLAICAAVLRAVAAREGSDG